MKTKLEDKITLLNWIGVAKKNGARIKKILELINLSVKSYKRWSHGALEDKRKGAQSQPKNKLAPDEVAEVISICNSEEFRNSPPTQIVPELLSRGIYIASESSVYRILRKNKLLTHRQNSLEPRTQTKPIPFVATSINQVWTWDITYLATTVRGQFFYLYLVLDIYSRKIMGATVHEKESSELAANFAREASKREGLLNSGLVLHSDNGSPMKGATMLATLHELGIQPSFSRPSVSNDNPYSESTFRTLKYRPEYPNKPFNAIEDAQKWVDTFVVWYNNEHRHSSLNFVTPNARHNGNDKAELEYRKQVLETAKLKTPERWGKKVRNCIPLGDVLLNPLKNNEEKSTIKKAS